MPESASNYRHGQQYLSSTDSHVHIHLITDHVHKDSITHSITQYLRTLNSLTHCEVYALCFCTSLYRAIVYWLSFWFWSCVWFSCLALACTSSCCLFITWHLPWSRHCLWITSLFWLLLSIKHPIPEIVSIPAWCWSHFYQIFYESRILSTHLNQRIADLYALISF